MRGGLNRRCSLAATSYKDNEEHHQGSARVPAGMYQITIAVHRLFALLGESVSLEYRKYKWDVSIRCLLGFSR
jgi:hypothetical protein